MLVTLYGILYFHMYIEISVRYKFLSAWITSFAISFSECLLVMYSFSFYIFEKNFYFTFFKKDLFFWVLNSISVPCICCFRLLWLAFFSLEVCCISYLWSFAQSNLKNGLPRWLSGKESVCQCNRCRRHEFNYWVGKTPWQRKWQPLQYSCLENPMDRGAWRATVHGIAKSWTQLKQLSSSSV